MNNRWTAEVESETLTDCERRLSAAELRYEAIEEQIAELRETQRKLDEYCEGIEILAQNELAEIAASETPVEIKIGLEWTREGKRERVTNVRGDTVMVARWLAPRRIVRRLDTVENVRRYLAEARDA